MQQQIRLLVGKAIADADFNFGARTGLNKTKASESVGDGSGWAEQVADLCTGMQIEDSSELSGKNLKDKSKWWHLGKGTDAVKTLDVELAS